jgi:hypothetical protein
MDSNYYHKTKKEILDLPICYRTIEAKEIIALGENLYSVGNATFEVSPEIANAIDHFAGIKKEQTQIAHDSYGEQGVTNLRNFFGQAEVKHGKRLVLAADTVDKRIVKALPIKNTMIPPEAFFDFAEMFMDKNDYLPEKVEYNQVGAGGISIMLKPVNEQIMEFSPGDDFVSNGIYLKWNPGEINLGNYYERLICSNGATQVSEHSFMQANSPALTELERMLDYESISALLRNNLEKMLVNARLAINTTASVRELGIASKILNRYGAQPDNVNKLLPYDQTREKYKQAGFPTDSHHMAQAKSEFSMWEIFNILTYFATHNKIWSDSDIRRSSLMEDGMTLLLRERDIKQYYNIF